MSVFLVNIVVFLASLIIINILLKYNLYVHKKKKKKLTLYSSRKSFPSSAERIRYSSSKLSTGMGKYVLDVEGDLGSKTTVCCSVEE